MYSMNLVEGDFPLTVEVQPPDSPGVGYRLVLSGRHGICSITMPCHLLGELVESATDALEAVAATPVGPKPAAKGTKMGAFVHDDLRRLKHRDFRVRKSDL